MLPTVLCDNSLIEALGINVVKLTPVEIKASETVAEESSIFVNRIMGWKTVLISVFI